MPAGFLLHLQRNWPLAAAALVLLAMVSYALFTGTVPTNQGSILRSREPAAYWRWLRRLGALLVLALAVLAGTFFLARR
ncbi:hypothetical protein [Rhodanobacter sp. DHB23]|uniref:hypothetical protein n=1 Tax=Rhodanobacter sp. DHB23 TaxID=2775923 RepID=UPI00177BA5E7|nr:hypothetical protein [Rhodanobacter sp. DHB23]MBD8874641.1 hypothetical protein [Rhodanobacter sp. DHB23]